MRNVWSGQPASTCTLNRQRRAVRAKVCAPPRARFHFHSGGQPTLHQQSQVRHSTASAASGRAPLLRWARRCGAQRRRNTHRMLWQRGPGAHLRGRQRQKQHQQQRRVAGSAGTSTGWRVALQLNAKLRREKRRARCRRAHEAEAAATAPRRPEPAARGLWRVARAVSRRATAWQGGRCPTHPPPTIIKPHFYLFRGGL